MQRGALFREEILDGLIFDGCKAVRAPLFVAAEFGLHKAEAVRAGSSVRRTVFRVWTGGPRSSGVSPWRA